MTEDERYMATALSLAELGRGQTAPNPLVGAVIVRNGEIVGQGAHLKAGGPHAEVHALRMAGSLAEGATAYVTLEPCSHFGRTPPCADALVAAKVSRVVVAALDPNPAVQGEGVRRLRAAGIEVVSGVLQQEARAQNEAYLTWRALNRPFVVWKCAATLDGYVATANGDSRYVTSPEARESVHELRRQHPAIAVGVGTVLADNPQLTVRLRGRAMAAAQPLRVVFDSQLRTPCGAALFEQPGQVRLYATAATASSDASEFAVRKAQLEAQGAVVRLVEAGADGRVSLTAALQDLAQDGFTSVLVEAGPRVAGALLGAKLVDKVVYYIAPKLLGSGLPAVAGRPVDRMAEALQLKRMTVSQVGPDLRVEGYLAQADDIAERGGGSGVYRPD
ncbi:bifunctional diaminohydroxyphosphoribosylaminopyrimidine deaminase/5-amino-6-(5-phosphoribosylamino)uracil reductase RibD [Alicyclobacillus sp. ALC3]|uniref:bifunctional diaminohydroxyphosphoribosylaminopyrimidine deaminase/5-amino-6-(5-phosphoribosylamino)uracil reductase RibD n=1 Tax=Alicyclobacillus sp. ALC3 TaxID=2796143 RepID=UPI002379C9F0|nr:bifunctional diaminohydroxyphosphoribosylaminopyrimidine deaminase/5-amino-6-(5-phosphoribosylamino)uracil reductase RibD [Alicyclobacillus sp. ALC3]WDL95580.1 bifunctional diaminohydroxyphosphoribosylaminopyrimidine deaminase/5-amino-6-(5-phosphoribosylamino)uracil reductase RibD [Alicyclobacillus sp. ALC3]